MHRHNLKPCRSPLLLSDIYDASCDVVSKTSSPFENKKSSRVKVNAKLCFLLDPSKKQKTCTILEYITYAKCCLMNLCICECIWGRKKGKNEVFVFTVWTRTLACLPLQRLHSDSHNAAPQCTWLMYMARWACLGAFECLHSWAIVSHYLSVRMAASGWLIPACVFAPGVWKHRGRGVPGRSLRPGLAFLPERPRGLHPSPHGGLPACLQTAGPIQ